MGGVPAALLPSVAPVTGVGPVVGEVVPAGLEVVLDDGADVGVLAGVAGAITVGVSSLFF